MLNKQTRWGENRYHSLNYELKNTFHTKVYKLSLDGGMTCPNRDGTLDTRGCIFCSAGGSGDFATKRHLNINEQINQAKKLVEKKQTADGKYIAYFQSYTNTYQSVSYLRDLFYDAIMHDDIVALSIATRPDCLSDEILELLSELNHIKPVWIELGLQTIHENTSKLINRCHTLENFENMVKKLKENNIEVVVHIINGLPYETKEMMIDTVKYLNQLDIDGIKIHMLNIVKDTPLEKLYTKEKFHILTKEEYVDIVISQLEHLNEKIVIHRITSDPDPKNLIAPDWLLKKTCLLNDIDKEMKKRNTYQGINL